MDQIMIEAAQEYIDTLVDITKSLTGLNNWTKTHTQGVTWVKNEVLSTVKFNKYEFALTTRNLQNGDFDFVTYHYIEFSIDSEKIHNFIVKHGGHNR